MGRQCQREPMQAAGLDVPATVGSEALAGTHPGCRARWPSDSGVRSSRRNPCRLHDMGSQRQWGQRLLQEPIQAAGHDGPATVGSEAPAGTGAGCVIQRPSDSGLRGPLSLGALGSGCSSLWDCEFGEEGRADSGGEAGWHTWDV